MRVVVDGLPVTGNSLAVVIQHLLEGWVALDNGDELHLVSGPRPGMTVPDGVEWHPIELGRRAAIGRLKAQSVDVVALCRRVRADVLLGALPTTTIPPLPCARAIVAYDLRHELRPEQFSRKSRMLRRLSYGVGFRQADGVICISDRTRQDLLRSRPWLRRRPVGVAHLGADHTDAWQPSGDGVRAALAFGQYGNKNVALVVEAWSLLKQRGVDLPIMIVGLNPQARELRQADVDARGLGDLVSLASWLSDEQFAEEFASARMIVFPSDFEGFGMPVAEAMRLGIPVVITPEPALLEVGGGHATVTAGWDAMALADAVVAALSTSDQGVADARRFAERYTWSQTARSARDVMTEAIARHAA